MKPNQTGFDFEPEYEISSAGTKHEFTGFLLVPTPDEMKRIAEEQKARDVANGTLIGLHFKKQPFVVRMNALEALKLRKGPNAKTF